MSTLKKKRKSTTTRKYTKYFFWNQKKFEDVQGVLEPVNQRTSNIMAKSQGTKGQTMVYNPRYRKLKIEQHEPR